MRQQFGKTLAALVLLGLAGFVPGHAGGHTWRVKEIFSNADGTVQFIEVWEAFGGAGETATAGHSITSNGDSFAIPSNVAAPTSFRSLLFGTQGFADLNVVTPDYIIPANFLSTAGDTISYTPLHSVTFGPGQLPTDGSMSLDANLVVVVNSPQNYAGDMGSVVLGMPPPGVPATGANPLTVQKLQSDGSSLNVAYDTATCSGNEDHQLLFGFGSSLPTSPGGVFGLAGASCVLTANPFEWLAVPNPAIDPSRLLWFLIQATDGTATEGSWGKDGNGAERQGVGVNGSSDQCGMTDKALSNSCGQ